MPDELADDLCSMSFGSSERSGSSTVSSTGSRSSLSSCSSIASVPKAGSVDPRLDLIRRLRSSDAARPGSALSPSDLRFVQRLGLGDIGSVYLEEVKCGGGELGERVVVAAKVMDKKEVEGRSKWGQARTEREILEMVGGHLFLPRLYGVVENDRWSCLLTDFCPSGDLHLLRQRQPNRRFPTPPSGNKRNAIPENATANTIFSSERGAGVVDDEKLRSLRSCSRVPM